MSGPLRNPRWERFCVLLFEGEPASAAYEKAGYSFNEGNAIRLKGNEKVQARLAELQLEAQKNSEVTVASLLGELEQARSKADSLGQLSAAVKAISQKAAISGVLVKRIEIGTPGDFEALDSVKAILDKIEDELGSDGAELLAAFLNVDRNGVEVLKPDGSAPFRRKLARFKARQTIEHRQDERPKLSPADIERRRLFGNGSKRF